MVTERAREDLRGTTSVTMRLLMLLSVAALLVAGCSVSAAGEANPTEEPPQPFSARRESDSGAVVEWSGHVEGYEPDEEATFNIAIENKTGEAWPGRFCLQLMDGELPQVIATLEQRPFNLEDGVGFSDTITVTFPENLDEDAYGLSLVVRGPAGPTVDLVPITVGETDAERRPATQEDMDAALEACPEAAGARSEAENLVTLAREDLAERADVDPDQIVVQGVEEVEFPDASLGVPEPDKMYAQVITPGYVIRLAVDGDAYEYHAAGERVVLAAGGAEETAGE